MSAIWTNHLLQVYNRAGALIAETGNIISAKGGGAWMEAGEDGEVVIPFVDAAANSLIPGVAYRFRVSVVNQVALTTHVICDCLFEKREIRKGKTSDGGDYLQVVASGRDLIAELAYRRVDQPVISAIIHGQGVSPDTTAGSDPVLILSPEDVGRWAENELVGYTIALADGRNYSTVVANEGTYVRFDPPWPDIVAGLDPPADNQAYRFYGLEPTPTSGNDTDLKQIMQYAPAWSFSQTSEQSTTEGTYHSPVGENVLRMLQLTSAQSGEYFWREPGARRIHWSATKPENGHPQFGGVVTLVLPEDPAAVAGDWQYAIIQPGTVFTYETTDRVTRVRPYGAGSGGQQLTLRDLPDDFVEEEGFTLDDQYLIYDAGEADGDYVSRDIRWPELAPANDTREAKEVAAKALYYSAIGWLKQHNTAPRQVKCRVVSHVPLYPVRTVMVDAANDGIFPTSYNILSVKAVLMGEGEGLFYDLELSTSESPELSDERIIAQAWRLVNAQSSHSAALPVNTRFFDQTKETTRKFNVVYGLPEFNVALYGADRSGATDSTEAFRNAAAAAALVGYGRITAGPGNYLLRYADVDAETAALLTIPQNVEFVGAGKATVFTFAGDGAASYTIDDGHYAGIRLMGNNRVEGFVINGNRDNITLSGDKIFYGLYCEPGSSNIIIRDVEVHSIPSSGSGKESFGITTRAGCHDIEIDSCHVHDCNGTGFSLSADNPLPGVEGNNGGARINLRNSTAVRCTWQGVSAYAVEHGSIADCRFLENERVGINLEWVRHFTVTDCESAYNTQNGFRVLGRSESVILGESYIHGNGATAELSISAGGYHRQIDGNDAVGMSGVVVLRNVRVERYSDEFGESGGSVHHLQIRTREQQDGETLYADHSYPQVILDSDNAENWNITGWPFHEEEPTLRVLPPGVEYRRARAIGRLLIGRVDEFDATGTITSVEPYAGDDAEGRNPLTITSSTQGAALNSDLIIPPNRLIRLRVRFKVTQPTGATWDNPDVWGINFTRTSGFGGSAAAIRIASVRDDDEWQYGEVVGRTGAGRYRVGVFYSRRSSAASTPGQVHIDWISVEELASDHDQSDGAFIGGRWVEIVDDEPQEGTVHPQFTYLRRRPVAGQPLGWIGAHNGGGTYGDLVAVTANTRVNPENLNVITVNDVSDLKPGDYITIAGATRRDEIGDTSKFNIVHIDAANNVYLDTPPKETLTGAAVEFAPPTVLKLFPPGDSQFLTELALGSEEGIVFPRDEGDTRLVRLKVVDGYLRPYARIPAPDE